MNPLLVVYAYSGMDEMLDRHWPFYERAGCDIRIVSPVDAACRRGGWCHAKSEHHGPEVMSRIFWGFKEALRTQAETFHFIEGDSIILKEAPRTLPDGFHGFLWRNHDPRYLATHYPHWSWSMNRNTLQRLADATDRYYPGDEEGFTDRLVGLICEQNGIEMIHRPDMSYSRNLIDRPEYIQQARDAISSGITFLHGIKTHQQLNSVLYDPLGGLAPGCHADLAYRHRLTS